MRDTKSDRPYIVNQLKKGDQTTLKTLYSAYYEGLCQHLLNFTQNRNLIEDLVQDTFLKLWLKRKKLDIKISIKSYLYKIATNNFIDNYRQKKKNDVFLESYYHQIILDYSEEDTEHRELRLKKLDDCVQLLPRRCKEVLVATKFLGRKNSETAKLFRISIKTVEGHISKAYSLIKRCMN